LKKAFNPKDVWEDNISLDFILDSTKSKSFYDFVQKRRGYVYVITHPDKRGILKIGRTSKDPFVRAKSLCTAGVLGSFDVLWVAEYANSSWAEATIHKLLSDYHFEKEFYSINLDQAKEILNAITVKENKLLRYFNIDDLFNLSYNEWLNGIDIMSLI